MDNGRLIIELSGVKRSIPLASFLRVANNALAILKNLDIVISERTEGNVSWRIEEVALSSPLRMTIAGEAERDPAIANQVVRAYVEGFESIEQAPDTPRYFNEGTLKHAKSIVSVLNDEISKIAFFANGSATAPTQRVAANVDHVIRRYEDMATFEGSLEMISIHGQMQFNIYDALTGKRIECYFPVAKLEEATHAFGKRVAVSGKASYSRAGKPVSIQVEEIVRLRDKNKLPQFGDVEGIDITGGADPTEYIGSLYGDD